MAAADRRLNTQVAARVTLLFFSEPEREFTKSPGWDQHPSLSTAVKRGTAVGTGTQSR